MERKMEGVSRELGKVREEGGRMRLELEGRGERLREVETELGDAMETIAEKEAQLTKREEV